MLIMYKKKKPTKRRSNMVHANFLIQVYHGLKINVAHIKCNNENQCGLQKIIVTNSNKTIWCTRGTYKNQGQYEVVLRPMIKLSKVCKDAGFIPLLVDWTPIFEQYNVIYSSEERTPQEDCIMFSSYRNTFRFDIEHKWKGLCDH